MKPSILALFALAAFASCTPGPRGKGNTWPPHRAEEPVDGPEHWEG